MEKKNYLWKKQTKVKFVIKNTIKLLLSFPAHNNRGKTCAFYWVFVIFNLWKTNEVDRAPSVTHNCYGAVGSSCIHVLSRSCGWIRYPRQLQIVDREMMSLQTVHWWEAPLYGRDVSRSQWCRTTVLGTFYAQRNPIPITFIHLQLNAHLETLQHSKQNAIRFNVTFPFKPTCHSSAGKRFLFACRWIYRQAFSNELLTSTSPPRLYEQRFSVRSNFLFCINSSNWPHNDLVLLWTSSSSMFMNTHTHGSTL